MHQHDRLIQKLKRFTFNEVEALYEADTCGVSDPNWFLVGVHGWTWKEFITEANLRVIHDVDAHQEYPTRKEMATVGTI